MLDGWKRRWSLERGATNFFLVPVQIMFGRRWIMEEFNYFVGREERIRECEVGGMKIMLRIED